MRLATFLKRKIDSLRNAGIDNPQLDAQLLVGHELGLDRVSLLSQSERDLSEREMRETEHMIDERTHGKSVARILGKREFWSLEFGLNEATLEPRPDSETLIEATLATLDGRTDDELRILDLGTGTGCLLLALLHEMPSSTGVGVDVNPDAVAQATQNAEHLGLSDRASFIEGNWFAQIEEKFDVIICNPPYIRSSELPSLMRDVRDFDPWIALNGGEDGLDPYRYLIPELHDYLNENGMAVFEVGQGQAQDVVRLFEDNQFFDITLREDLGGIERCIVARR